MLAPGGRLVSVMSPGFTFRQDGIAKGFRSFVEEVGGEVEELPPESFKESGTNIATVLVTLDKE
jgi:hypothetical protein